MGAAASAAGPPHPCPPPVGEGVLYSARDQFGHSREQVRFQAVISHAEDRRFGVLVDRHDDLAVLHAGQVLDRAGNAGGDVQAAARRSCRSGPLASRWGRSPHRRRRGEAPRAAPSLSASGVSTSLNFSLEPIARPPETMILAAVSSGRSLLAISEPRKLDLPLSATRRGRFDGGGTTGGGRGVKAGGAHGDHFGRVQALHDGDRVAGVDGALKGVGGDRPW